MKESKALVKKADATLATPPVLEEWQKKLQAEAKDQRANLTVGTPRIKHKSGVLTIEGKKVEDNKLRVVPLGWVWSKVFYKSEWEEGSTDTPVCYAFGPKERGLIPHEAVPEKQAESCDTCPHNKYGTALRGNGKRCGDRPRMLVILADDLQRYGEDQLEKGINKAQAYQIEIPPTSSNKKLAPYVKSLDGKTSTGSILEAVTEIGTEPRAEGGYFVTFDFLDAVPKAAMPYIVKRSEQTWDLLTQPFPVLAKDDEEKAPEQPVKGQEAKGKTKAKGRR